MEGQRAPLKSQKKKLYCDINFLLWGAHLKYMKRYITVWYIEFYVPFQ